MKASLCDGVDWVGAVDWNVRDFHSFTTDRGATYNAYLVRAGKTALIDTVKAPFTGRLLEQVRDLVDLAAVDYLVCNHAEPDHAGAVPAVLAACPNATLLGTKKCLQALEGQFDLPDRPTQAVGAGDVLDLGGKTLRFIPTPMVHWPDSMATFCPEARILFSMDAFGQHYASSGRFDDDAGPLCDIMAEAKAYYANIVMPYGKQVTKVLDALADLDIAQLATAHGVVWRRYVDRILAAYARWAAGRLKPRVVIVYDTMWGATEVLAEAIAEGVSAAGVEARLLHLRRNNLTRLGTEMLDAAAVAVGTPTLNGGMMPAVGAALTYCGGLKPPAKAAAAFGAAGWGRGGPEAVHEALTGLGWDLLADPLRCRYRPDATELAAARELGASLAAAARARAPEGAATDLLCVNP